jgi:hypothetical protein
MPFLGSRKRTKTGIKSLKPFFFYFPPPAPRRRLDLLALTPEYAIFDHLPPCINFFCMP